ncbi:MAG: alpha/beta fold hydrolase [Tumebacillaceae bacterium]
MSKLLKQLKTSTTNKQLICFPFAGGYSTAFRPIAQAIKSDWGVIAIEPPGHGTNRDPFLTSIDEMADAYVNGLRPYLNTRFALFGHSMGGWVTYKIAQKLEAQGLYPEVVIISGIRPPGYEGDTTADMSDKEFIDYVVSLGGIPEEMLAHQELVDLFLPALRADFGALDTFDITDRTPLRAPVHFLAGTDDPENTPEQVKDWVEYAPNAQFHTFEGKHMFILSHAPDVAKLIQQILQETVKI